MWKLFELVVTGSGILLLVGCTGAFVPPPVASSKVPPVYHREGKRVVCEQELNNTNSYLQQAKQDAKTDHVSVQFDQSDAGIVAALDAKNHQDYTACTLNALQVYNYVQRDENYIQWKASLRPNGW